MNQLPPLFVEGLAFWAPTLPGWAHASAAFRGEGALADPPEKRPMPQMLGAAERRRAPDTVAIALEVAAAAVAASGHDPKHLPSVFCSAHGDLAVNDYMCSTLAQTPLLLSPTKFHNSVHNAPAGYWTIGSGCMESSSALTAFDCSFAAGLLEAAVLCAADDGPVLLAGVDVAACGGLASVTHSEGLLGAALVLSPVRGPACVAVLDIAVAHGAAERTPLQSAAARSLAGNALADGLPLFEAFAGLGTRVGLPLSATLSLQIEVKACRR